MLHEERKAFLCSLHRLPYQKFGNDWEAKVAERVETKLLSKVQQRVTA